MSDGSTKFLERRSDGSTISSEGSGNSQSGFSSDGAGAGGGGGGSINNPFAFAIMNAGENDGYVSDLTDPGGYDNDLITDPPGYFNPKYLPKKITLSLDEFGRLNGVTGRATL